MSFLRSGTIFGAGACVGSAVVLTYFKVSSRKEPMKLNSPPPPPDMGHTDCFK